MSTKRSVKNLKDWGMTNNKTLSPTLLGLTWGNWTEDGHALQVEMPQLQWSSPNLEQGYYLHRLPKASLEQIWRPLTEALLKADPWSVAPPSGDARPLSLFYLSYDLHELVTEVVSNHIGLPARTSSLTDAAKYRAQSSKAQSSGAKFEREWLGDVMVVTATLEDGTQRKFTWSSAISFSCREVEQDDKDFWTAVFEGADVFMEKNRQLTTAALLGLVKSEVPLRKSNLKTLIPNYMKRSYKLSRL